MRKKQPKITVILLHFTQEKAVSKLFHIQLKMLLGLEFSRKTLLTDVLAVFGLFILALSLLKLTWKCCRGFRQYVLSSLRKANLQAYGQWAVVTGATSGIGKAYAIELARRGLDVVLIGRSVERLHKVAKEIKHRYGRKTHTIRVDFTEGGSIYPTIAHELHDMQIGILVNNVGIICNDHFAYFLETPDPGKKITEIINCNVLAGPQMTSLILPRMVLRGRGLIINISSEMGLRPHPLVALYSASKTFVIHFSQSLHAEYKSVGITVQCVTPFMVSTNMTNNLKVNLFVKSAPGFVYDALNTVGHSTFTSGCLSHALQSVAFSILVPDWLRMSTFFIRWLRKSGNIEGCRKDVPREEKQGKT
ncbi:very-long-chain 3-oxoacyl-CoA reductase-like [Poecilia reticulata]|uniref:20beta-hydroxysteroid dehydrogenase type 2 n=1 Tax=Poecilia reticulata TaxID=8081 RepID=A0A088Q747_POERE|nr:very-long-chain 3-oxoacyl-CoA reductase-like [Poecilia reticulata]AIN79098.1 20beta-hydroxysteroid dehydrogenase type 2 [Poecilia reticulata]